MYESQMYFACIATSCYSWAAFDSLSEKTESYPRKPSFVGNETRWVVAAKVVMRFFSFCWHRIVVVVANVATVVVHVDEHHVVDVSHWLAKALTSNIPLTTKLFLKF